MKRLLPLAVLLAISGTTVAQLPRIVVQGNSTPTVYTDINLAIAAAQPNDRIYLSGGAHVTAENMVLDKPLHFVGAGIDPDSTAATGSTTLQTGSWVYCTTASSGTSFTGIRFLNWVAYGNGTNNSDFDDPTGMFFQRCRFTKFFTVEAGSSSSSTTFDECIFSEELNGNNSAVAVLNNCIFLGSSGPNSFSLGGLTAKNCVFLGNGPQQFSGNGSALYQNCVFQVAMGNTSNLDAVYQNCIFLDANLPAQSTGGNNIFNQTAGSIFVDETDNALDLSDDLHLANGNPGINAGTDGTDIGLYGSAAPWKEGSVPPNPHCTQVSVAGSTDANGDLPVTITVAAQQD